MRDQLLELTLSALLPPGADASNVLWIVDENLSPELMLNVRPFTGLTVMTNRFDVQQKFAAQGFNVLLSDFDFTDIGQFDRIVYRVSKEKLLAHHCINQSLRHLARNGQFIITGNKQDGIKSIVKNTSDAYRLKSRAKKHGSSYSATFLRPADDVLVNIRLPDEDYGNLRLVSCQGMDFYSKPGVFGWEKVDRGSQLLVSALADVCKYIKSVDSVIDIGCGWGYLMMSTQSMNIARCVATDNNVAAIEAAQKNFAARGMDVECRLDDCAEHVRERFDLILCNPPFHQGFSIGENITIKFLKAAARMSRRSTRAVFVVNQFIPMEKLAADYFSQIRVMAAQNGFTVYELRP